jgi:hypothetical protein
MRGACCLHVHSTDSCKQLWSWPMGRNDVQLLSMWCGIGKTSTGWGSRILQTLILIDAVSSAC